MMIYAQPYALSLNHSWTGTAAVSMLMQGTLGLRIVEPGFRLVELSPNWTAFEWVKPALPTPHGNIDLDYEQSRGAVLHLPAGVSARLAGGGLFSGPGVFTAPARVL